MVPATDFNAMMSFTYNNTIYDWPVIATEDTDTYVVSVDNFAGIGTTPVTFTLAEDKTWSADQTVFYTSGDNNFAFYAIDGENFVQETGTGTEKVLTFGQNWTGYDTTTNYWLGERSATTITLISDEEFVYPATELPEPVITLDTEFGTYNEAQTVHVSVENMPEGGSVKYELTPSAAKAWSDYDDATGIVVNESAALVVAVFDANGEELTRVEGEYTISPSTAIETISTTAASNTWYNLQGQKFNGKPAAPGIYINGGKKVVVK